MPPLDDPRLQVSQALLASASESVMALTMPSSAFGEPVLRALPQTILGSIFDPIREWLDAVAAYLKSIPERLTTWLRAIRDRIPTFPSPYDLAVGFLTHTVIPAINAAGPILAGILSAPLRWVKEALESLPRLFDFAREIWNKVVIPAVTWIGARIRGFINSPLGQAIIGVFRAIRDNLSLVWQAIITELRGIWAALQPILQAVREALGRVVTSISNSVREMWSSMVAWVHSHIIEPLKRWIREHLPSKEEIIAWAKDANERLVGMLTGLMQNYLAGIAGEAGTDLAMNPSRSMAMTGPLIMRALYAGAAAHGVSTALEILYPTKEIGLTQFAGLISEFGAFQPIMQATMGTLVYDVLAWPMRYHWQNQLRPKLPTIGEIFTMGRKRGITEERFFEAMGYMGLPNWWIDTIYHFFWTDPSPFWISRICESGIPDWHPDLWWSAWADRWMPGWRTDDFKWVRAKLLLAGYEASDAPSMIEGIKMRLLGPATTQLKTSARSMARKGWWDFTTFSEFLRGKQVRGDEIALAWVAEQVDQQREILEEWVAIYTMERRKGTIDVDQHRLALAALGMHPVRAEQEVLMETIRLLPAPKKPEEPKEDPDVVKARATFISAQIQLFRKRVVDPFQLYGRLLAFGLTEARARSTVLLEGARRLKAPAIDHYYFDYDTLQEMLGAEYEKARAWFLAARITEEQYLYYLFSMGFEPKLAQYLVDLDVLELFVRSLPAG